MQVEERPYVLTIAGHDPSGGAGLNADIKAMEAIGVQGLSICTSVTYQTEDTFEGVSWIGKKQIKKQLVPILERYKIDYVKIGIIRDPDVLLWLVRSLKDYHPHIFIIWDPVLSTSTGFRIQQRLKPRAVKAILEYVDLITPNWHEIAVLSKKRDPFKAARHLSKYCSVYLKGGHNEAEKGIDYLWAEGTENAFVPEFVSAYEKHGSGCVFSAALISYLSLAYTLDSACVAAKRYVAEYLDSSEQLLGIHYQML